METSRNRRLLIAIGFVVFFVVIVLVWYFFYAKPIVAPTLNGTNDPLPTRIFPPRSSFIFWRDTPSSSTTTTEIIDPLKDPLIKIWGSPSTGQTFISSQILQEITATSTSGSSTILVKKTVRATSTALLFVDRTTGYVYGHSIETGKTYQVSNTIVPGVYDAYFFENGKRIIMRYLDQEKNAVVGLIATVPDVMENGSALPLGRKQYLTSQVVSVAVNQKKDEVSYVVATERGSAAYTVGKAKDPILAASSPFREWNISYGGNTLYVTTKPSAYVEGSTFSLPFFQAEIIEKTGLMTTPLESDTLLNSMWGKNGLVTFFSKNGDIKVLPIQTLAPKCAWGRKAILVCAIPRMIPFTTEGLPDDWFQGRISFEDDLAIIDKNTGDKYPLYDFSEADGFFDIVGITVSLDTDLFSFNNKKDGSLWLLNTNLIQGE